MDVLKATPMPHSYAVGAMSQMAGLTAKLPSAQLQIQYECNFHHVARVSVGGGISVKEAEAPLSTVVASLGLVDGL